MTKRTAHLTEEALFEIATARLSDSDLLGAKEHLAKCVACRERLQQIEFAREAFLGVSKLGIREVMESVRPRSTPITKGFAFPWKPVVALALGCVCIFAILFYPRTVPTASAAELLTNAIQNEDRVGDSKLFRVHVKDETCAGGRQSERMVSLENSERCSRALRQLKNTPWGHGNPLSARTYASWRSSLGRHRDEVAKREASYVISTVADENAIREASLELRTTDYHATELTIDFSDNEEISISEDTEPLPTIPVESTVTEASKKELGEAQHIDDPADLLELQAWSMLQRLNADSGWEGIVRRSGSNVIVKAIAKDEERRQQLEAGFAGSPGIELEVHLLTDGSDDKDILPDRARPTGNEPGLAENWLEQQFVDGASRARFSNNALHLSQQILGRAYIIDQLQRRQQAMSPCSCAKNFTGLITDEKLALAGLQEKLRRTLEPLIGADPHLPPHPLTLREARDLDSELEGLFTASAGRDELAFNQRVKQVRRTL